MAKNETSLKSIEPADSEEPALYVVAGGSSPGENRGRRWLIALAFALIAGGVYWEISKQAHEKSVTPAAPVALLTPKVKQMSWLKPDESITFSWSGAETASLQIAADRKFLKITKQFDHVKSPYMVSALQRDKTYFWRVVMPGQDAQKTEIRELFVGALASPTPLYPPSGSRKSLHDAILAWQDKPRVDIYRVQLAIDHKFTDVVRDFTVGGGTRYQMSDLPPGRYYWRVSARDRQALRHLWSAGRSIVIVSGREPAGSD